MKKDEDDVSLWDIDLVCNECQWDGISKNTEFTTNNGTVLMVCPRCGAVDNFEVTKSQD